VFALLNFTPAHFHYSGAGEKETLSSQHKAEPQKQREETARLKEELIQLKLKHNAKLKQAAESGKSELDHARKELEELHVREVKEIQDQLHGELKSERDLRELEKKRNDALQEVRDSQAKIIVDLDEKVRSKFFRILF
jgi:F0F1-type ATP synthase membrane subunit b/b'